MNNVIGPIDGGDWLTLLMLKKSINFMKNSNNREKYKIAIDKEQSLYNHILRDCSSTEVRKEAA